MQTPTTPRLMMMLTLALALGAQGCGGSGGNVNVPGQNQGMMVTAPNQSVFLRVSFDDDPSTYVGRFIPDELGPGQIDENRAATTRCSEFITIKQVNASGTFDEVFNTSTSASASLGVAPMLGGAKAGMGSSSALRVSYKLKRKMRAEVADPAGLDRCCKAAPDQCAQQIIGEFFYGSGRVYQAAGSQSEFEADGITPTAQADIDFKDSIAWKRVTEFEDVYFAFRTQAVMLGGSGVASADDDCSWTRQIPTSLDGQFFVGVSDPLASRSDARDKAMLNARTQAVRYLGQVITSQESVVSSSLEGYMDNRRAIQAASKGVARFVKDQKWCVEPEDSPDGRLYTAQVLAFFPKEKEKEAARQTVLDIGAALKAEGALKPGDEAKLQKLADSIK